VLRQLKPYECIGHSVKYIKEEWSTLIVVFDHGYIAYAAQHDYRDESTRLINIGDTEHGLYEELGKDAVISGIMTQDEYDAITEKKKKERQAKEEKWERGTYERLKAKFEGPA
jgi:hypothetical protein